ncbi:uridine kinase [Nocardioides albertanoniae]|uniref:Uridine kinase n=1 Tax=Nocardioides albertanoniae TaxID=1175486 RepID=A0A543A848_9ACTN|nr:4-amino-4-deoxy-L-arabinose transferase [Nocardioides albertanoniae]TQL68771.1 uridine kinase [Nocardioides albertanoniae]
MPQPDQPRADRPDRIGNAAADLLTITMSRPASLGPGRVICVDGPAGSGKTTVADAVAGLSGSPVIHMDDLYAGWDGIAEGIAQFETILTPLVEGAAGSYRRYDWHRGEFAETVLVPPAPLLVIEGVGSGAAAYSDLRTALAWVDAPPQVRRARGIERDGDTFAPRWDEWAIAETDLFAREMTAARADIVVLTDD